MKKEQQELSQNSTNETSQPSTNLSFPQNQNQNGDFEWEIPYTDITSADISIDTAVVFVRERNGNQVVPSVKFDRNTSNVIITISSTASQISASRYTAIIMGSAIS